MIDSVGWQVCSENGKQASVWVDFLIFFLTTTEAGEEPHFH